MKIGITNDHRGYKKKQYLTNYLESLGYTVIDYGAASEESVDFPDYAKKLGKAIQNKDIDFGVAICGTGIGMSIALNKMNDIVCAKVSSVSEAILSKSHNDANVIAISEEMSDEVTEQVIIKFIESEDGDNGESIREALNDLTRYKNIVAYKYRKYLDEKYLKLLIKKIALLEYELNSKLMTYQDEFTYEEEITTRRSR